MGGNGKSYSCKAIHGMLFAYLGAGSRGIAVDIMVVYVDTFVRISFPVLGGTDVPESLHFRLGSVDTLWRFTLSKEKKILCLDKKIW